MTLNELIKTATPAGTTALKSNADVDVMTADVDKIPDPVAPQKLDGWTPPDTKVEDLTNTPVDKIPDPVKPGSLPPQPQTEKSDVQTTAQSLPQGQSQVSVTQQKQDQKSQAEAQKRQAEEQAIAYQQRLNYEKAMFQKKREINTLSYPDVLLPGERERAEAEREFTEADRAYKNSPEYAEDMRRRGYAGLDEKDSDIEKLIDDYLGSFNGQPITPAIIKGMDAAGYQRWGNRYSAVRNAYFAKVRENLPGIRDDYLDARNSYLEQYPAYADTFDRDFQAAYEDHHGYPRGYLNTVRSLEPIVQHPEMFPKYQEHTLSKGPAMVYDPEHPEGVSVSDTMEQAQPQEQPGQADAVQQGSLEGIPQQVITSITAVFDSYKDAIGSDANKYNTFIEKMVQAAAANGVTLTPDQVNSIIQQHLGRGSGGNGNSNGDLEFKDEKEKSKDGKSRPNGENIGMMAWAKENPMLAAGIAALLVGGLSLGLGGVGGSKRDNSMGLLLALLLGGGTFWGVNKLLSSGDIAAGAAEAGKPKK